MKLKMTMLNIKAEFAKLKDSREKSSLVQEIPVVAALKQELVAATPIDTGAAREAWSVSKGAFGYNLRNSVPYISRLNQGSSQQAPSHFIEAIALKYGKPVGVIVEEDQ